MTFAIFGNTNKRETINEVNHLLDFMKRHNARVLLSSELRNEMNIRDEYALFTPDAEENIDFALSVGGDGTFLNTAAQVVDKNIPILGINCGHLGFLADVKTDDVDEIMKRLLQGDYAIERRSMLEVSLTKTEGVPASGRKTGLALNEIAVLKQELSSMISIEAFQNGEPLNNYFGDGLIISTPTGSTAYNLSAGGPIAVPQAGVFLLTPVASHSLSVRPLIIPDEWQLDLRVHSRSGAYLISIDGRSWRLTDDNLIHVEKSGRTVSLVRLNDHSFIHSLKTKLNWGNE